MQKTDGNRLNPPGELAINRVLQAERDARRDMAQCDQHAEALLREAGERARQIRRRTDHRIQAWCRHYAQRAADRVETLHRQERALTEASFDDPVLPEAWRAAVDSLADELIGLEQERDR